jgi:plasmid stability protein
MAQKVERIPEDVTWIRTWIPNDLHSELKVLAARKNVSVQQFTREALAAALESAIATA